MNQTMRGYGMERIHVATWLHKPIPHCGPLDAIIRPKLLAPCTSDVHTLHGGAGSKEQRILGHEAIGEVVTVGALVTRFAPGDVVLVPSTTPDWLASGIQNPKSNGHDAGIMGSFKFVAQKDGVFAEFFHVNHADGNLCHLPHDLDPVAALMCVDMMNTGFLGAELADISFGDRVVVLGIGPVGLMAVAGAALRGAGQIIAVGTRPVCVELAKHYGASTILSYQHGDLVQQVRALTGGGADRVIIAGGNADSVTQAIRMTGPMGTVANVNFFQMDDVITLPALSWNLGMANKDIRSGFCPGGSRRLEALLALVRHGRIDPSKLVTHRFYGFDQIEPAFRLMEEKPPDLIKPVIFVDAQ